MRSNAAVSAMIMAATLAVSASPRAGEIVVDALACRQQLETVVRLDVDCVVLLHPGSLENVPAELSKLLSELICRAPLKFRKSQIYGEWITGQKVRSADIPLDCRLGPTEITAAIRIECDRRGVEWQCAPILHGVKELGFLGTALEAFVNGDAALQAALTKALTRPGLGRD